MSDADYFGHIVFRLEWRKLARQSKCDSLNGMEYRRVYKEWVTAGRPVPIAPFIQEAANRPPTFLRIVSPN